MAKRNQYVGPGGCLFGRGFPQKTALIFRSPSFVSSSISRSSSADFKEPRSTGPGRDDDRSYSDADVPVIDDGLERKKRVSAWNNDSKLSEFS
ncbi:hypothetical protein GWI33_014256 [Rhynchophorus ferrugineus]|uniref:Uncharacterized protein n=1 Tax=Rhynchophorus ferrugineus TaxID=354439 RepID=A0A834I214_RHYFE|nr:hypothetical protein GWI33_014256 [Rhynchophorus ferrugineus]